MKILITGGAGFIGYFISRILAENKENEIYIIDDLSKGKMDEMFLVEARRYWAQQQICTALLTSIHTKSISIR